MLEIILPASASDLFFDESTETYMGFPEVKLQLEHSLLSLSKWESKWCKPFLGNKEHSIEETIDYIRCMTVNKVDDAVYLRLTDEDIVKVNEYINAPMSATTFIDSTGKKRSHGYKKLTSEEIYYMMFAQQIPKDCEKWHLNRLLTLLRVFGEKNQPSKKMSKKELAKRNTALNAARRAKLNSKG